MDEFRDILGVSSQGGKLIAGNDMIVVMDNSDVDGMYSTICFSRENEEDDWGDGYFSYETKSEIIVVSYLLCLREGLEFFEGVIFDKKFTLDYIENADEDGDIVSVYKGDLTSVVGNGYYELTAYRDEPNWSITIEIEGFDNE